ncbi:hypothetical protein BDV19DRAFT_396625 [Aspergillus venezuelensis]
MTRVTRRSTSVFGRRSPIRIARRKARKHKVILESITQAKKKLRSVISFEAKAPPGYTFISAGDPQFTTTCKEICRRDGLKVYAVSTTPHLHTHGLSQHVHRIGYHFPSAVVADVCSDRGLYLTGTGKAVSFHDMNNDASRGYADSTSQITINTEARDVLKDLFPNIPDNDLNQIIKTAFQKGQRKVGTAAELPLARRAQLAVVAHIRHIYTNYDRLLKATSFHEARATVEQPTLAKLVEWRGDDENGKTVLEDVFREVIVISDDDDSDFEGDSLPLHGRNTSVEVISSNPVVEELQMRPVNHDTSALRESRVEHYEDEAAPGFRFIPEVPKKTKADRRGFSRYQAWDRAINRYRNTSNGSIHRPPPYSVGNPSQENLGQDRGHIEPHHSLVTQPVPPNQRIAKSTLSRPSLNPVAEHRVNSVPSPCPGPSPRESRLSNPTVLTLEESYELHPLVELPDTRRDATLTHKSPNVPMGRVPLSEPMRHDSFNGPVFVSGPREYHDRNTDGRKPLIAPPAGHLHNRNLNQQDCVLPSIESPISGEIQRPASGHIEHLTRRMSGAFNFRSVTPHRQPPQVVSDYAFPQDSDQDRATKRRCVAYHEPISTGRRLPATGPITSSTHPGARYAAAETSSVHVGHQPRRIYVAPSEPLRIGEQIPGGFQESTISSTRSDREPEIFPSQGHVKAYDREPFPHRQFVDSQASQNRYSDLPRMAPDATYIIAARGGHDRASQPQPPNASESRMPHDTRTQDFNSARAEAVVPAPEATWWSRENAPYKSEAKHGLYADGFVRPVDIHEPGPPEYRSSRRVPSSHLLKTPPQSFKPKFQGVQHRRVPSDSAASVSPRGRFRVDSPAKAPYQQQHPIITNQQSRHYDKRQFATPPPVYRHGRQPEHALPSSRYGHK